MSLVISRDIVLALAAAQDANCPLVGWHNIVTTSNIIADTQNANYPVTNLANPQTFSRWQAADTTEQYITITTGTVEEIDYVGIARHNLSSSAIPVSIEGKLGAGAWIELVQDSVLPDDGPALFRFDPQTLTSIRIRLQAGTDPATIAVVYVGKLLVMERKIYVGQTPMPHGKKQKVTSGLSESGQYLGGIVVAEWTATKVPLSLLDPVWYRANMVPFLATRPEPFFFAWRPQDYPKEVGYAWLVADPVPVNEGPSGLVALTLDLNGVT